jgi:hypothetical protein
MALAAALAASAAAGAEPQPRDLTPVTRLEAPAHPPVEIVRDGAARAVVYVADPKGREKSDPKNHPEGVPGASPRRSSDCQ